jgi:hypothetical protein
MVCHSDVEIARQLVAGGLTTFARFQVMHGTHSGPVGESQRRVLDDLHDQYDMKHHTQAGSPQTKTLTPEFIDEYAIVGPAAHCIERLRSLAVLGLERIIVIGPSAGSDRTQARLAVQMLAAEILPEFATAQT